LLASVLVCLPFGVVIIIVVDNVGQQQQQQASERTHFHPSLIKICFCIVREYLKAEAAAESFTKNLFSLVSHCPLRSIFVLQYYK